MIVTKVQIEITDEHLLTLFSDATYGASYWAELEVVGKYPKTLKGTSFEEKLVNYVMRYKGSFIIHDPEDEMKYTCDKKTVVKALKIMAEKYPEHLYNLLTENDDAETGDVFFQCMCFDDVIYG